MSKTKTPKNFEAYLQEVLIPEEEQPFIVAGNWQWINAGEVLDFVGGGTPSKSNQSYWNGDIPWTTVKDVKSRYLTSSIDNITLEGFKNSSASIASPNEVLLITRMSPGKSTITKITTAINQDLKIVKPKINVLPLFLWLFFEINKPLIESISTGSTVKGIQVDKLKKLPFPLVPVEEQRRIIEKAETLINKIDEAKQLIEEAKESFELRRAAILDKAFRGELDTHDSTEESLIDNIELIEDALVRSSINDNLPKNWFTASFNSVVKIFSGNALTKKNMNEDGNIPVFGGNGITGSHDQSNLYEETIVIGRVGFYCGSIHMTPKLAWVTDNAFKVSFSNDLFDKKYLYWHLKNLNLNKFSNSSAQPVISGKTLQGVEILVPPLKEQKRIAEKIETLLEKLDFELHLNERAMVNIKKLRDSILLKAFRGELGTNDPTEENAIELLKEVLREKAK